MESSDTHQAVTSRAPARGWTNVPHVKRALAPPAVRAPIFPHSPDRGREDHDPISRRWKTQAGPDLEPSMPERLRPFVNTVSVICKIVTQGDGMSAAAGR